MPLDPQVKALLDQLKAVGGPQLHEMPVPQAREAMAAMVNMEGPGEEVARVENRRIPGPLGDIPVRIYTPAGQAPFPVLVYFHGGGWVIGDLETHDRICRALANRAGCMVLSVDYRRAPENRFPAALEDCYGATLWVAHNAESLGADAGRIAIGGDSAGGNLTAVVALMARDRKEPQLRFQLLIYPVADCACDTPSYSENAEGYLLTRDAMRWFWDHYIRDARDRENPYASPLRVGSTRATPAALVLTAEFDPLRDEGERYAARLRDDGVDVTLTRYDGMIHGFFGMTASLDQARTAMDQAATALRRAFE